MAAPFHQPLPARTPYLPSYARWGLSILAIAAMLGCNGYEPLGSGVGYLDDGSLAIDINYVHMTSADGGLTWRPVERLYRGRQDVPIHWGNIEVDTPRGTYVLEVTHRIEEMRVVRVRNGNSKVVYSTPDLRTEADVRFQDFHDDFIEGCIYCYPRNMVYHAPTGNIVVAMGWEQTVLVGDSAENWTQILLTDEYVKKECSFSEKLRAVINTGIVWPAAVALAIAATAAALAYSQRNRAKPVTDVEMAFALFAPPIAILALVVLLYGAFLLLYEIMPNYLMGLLFLLLFAGITYLVRKKCLPFALACAFWVLIASLVILASLFTSHPESITPWDIAQVAGFVASIPLSVLAIAAFPPSLRQLPIVVLATPAMVGLVVLAFAIGIAQGFQLGLAKLYAVLFVLVATYAYALGRWAERSQRPS